MENRNKAIREYIPKRSDISAYRHMIDYAQDKLRNRFMVVLGGLSPQEVWDAEMKKHAECVRRKKVISVLKIKPSVRFEG